jgi:acetyl esterase/lipase
MRKILLAVMVFAAVLVNGAEKIRLWEGDAPLAKGNREIDIPTLEIFLPENKDSKPVPAVVICPGGAYSGLAYTHEGVKYAKLLNKYGVACFVLKYRTGSVRNGSYRYPAPQMDAHRAIRMVRANAKKWNIDPAKVGIMGSSAGGHLTAMTAVKNDLGNPDAADVVERFSSRPDFFILCYAQTSMDKRYGACCGSRKNLIGDDESKIGEVAAYAHVNKNTPPGFIWHTYSDKTVPVRNALDMANAMEEHKVPYSLHIYHLGKHGLGVGKANDLHPWTKELIFWMKDQGIIK